MHLIFLTSSHELKPKQEVASFSVQDLPNISANNYCFGTLIQLPYLSFKHSSSGNVVGGVCRGTELI